MVPLAIATAAELQQRTLLLAACTLLVLFFAFGAWLLFSRGRLGGRRAIVTAVAVAVVWVVCGNGLVFGAPLIRGFLGNPFAQDLGTAIGHSIAVGAFQGSLAVLTLTIVACAVGDRVPLWPWLVFVALWTLVAYAPVAYAEFNMTDGWLFTGLQINDQAGGALIHVTAGAAALALLVVTRPPRETSGGRTGAVVAGAALIWIGALGLVVGSEGRVDALFATIVTNTLIAPALAAIAWPVVQFLMTGRATVRGVASGLVSGVVAITPACNILTPSWAALLGLLAGAICAATVTLLRRSRFGERLDITGIHLVGGAVGLTYVGLLGNGIGWKDSGQPDGIADQAGAALGVAAWSFLIACLLAWLLRPVLSSRR
jgi:Amt family ammonium transporter